jgi:Transposase and inactivated derivatives
MERYIGLDVHAASTTFAVIGESGKRLGTHIVETNGQALVEQLKSIPGKRHVCLEEGTQSAWIYEILSPHAEEVVVAMVPESRGQKSDERDAFHLAEQLRTGAIKKRVFKEVGAYKTLRELGHTHAMVVQDVVRVQNRIKALYRSRGVAVSGKSVYAEKGREEFLEKLPEASRGAAKTLYAQYDAVEEIRRQAEKELVKEAHRHPISRVLESCPGLGPIRVAQLIPIVVSPMRFRTKRQFWSYCGLGIVMRSSSDWVPTKDGGWVRAKVQQTRGLNLNHNHTLKSIFKGAATTVITQLETEPLRQDYQRLITAGTKPNLAKLTIARKLAAIALSMWKSKEKYDPTKHRKQG